MADWNDPQSTRSHFGGATINGEVIGAVTRDEGLRRYMLGIYNYMASGVLLSGIVALLTVRTGMAIPLFTSGLGLVVAFVPLGIALALGFGLQKMSAATVKALFWVYCLTMGLSLSIYLLAYTGASVAVAFFSAAGAFAGLSLFGYTTKRSLSAMGAFMWMGLIGLIIASLVNLFLQSTALTFALSYLSVVIFAGLTAWHTQALKQQYDYVRGTDAESKAMVYGALILYTDFINLFISLLRILGDRR